MSDALEGLHLTRDRGSAAQVLEHLHGCGPAFVVRLAERTDLEAFAGKIVAHAARFEAWSGAGLAGMVAAYCNDQIGRRAFVTHVGVWPALAGRGLAARLLESCLAHAVSCGMRSVELEVARENARAIALYRGFGFETLATEHADLAMRLSLQPGGTP